MSWNDRLREVRAGFEPAFWVANFTELFERTAYYCQSAVVAVYLHESLGLSIQQTTALTGIVGFVVWFLPVLGGSLADRFGFRRTLAVAYLILAGGYFLMGSIQFLQMAPWMAPLRERVPFTWLVLGVLLVPALGPSVVKPVVAGTTARATSEAVRSLGFSLYYTLVNIGGMLGPFVANRVREHFGIASAFRTSAIFVLAMFFVTIAFYREPRGEAEDRAPGMGAALRNMVRVLSNGRFVVFLLIFSGFWIVFWQQFATLPLYLRGYVNPKAPFDLLLSVDAATVIALQLVVSYLTRKIPALTAMTIGILISSCSWLVLSVNGSTGGVVMALVVLAIGEITQSARFYEYVSRLAPPGQQGTYMGYAFLPVAIGYLIGAPLGGYLLHEFGDVRHRPAEMWWVISGVGFATVGLMLGYNAWIAPGEGAGPTRMPT